MIHSVKHLFFKKNVQDHPMKASVSNECLIKTNTLNKGVIESIGLAEESADEGLLNSRKLNVASYNKKPLNHLTALEPSTSLEVLQFYSSFI